MKIQPVILAAGKGTRMKSELPKPLFPLAGKAMIRYVIETLQAAEDVLPPIIVVGHQGDLIKKELGDKYRYAEQTELSGTATAVKAALPLLDDQTPALVLYGDNPFITTESINRIRDAFMTARPTLAMFSVALPDYDDWRALFKAFGRVKRDLKGQVTGIVEYKNASEAEREIKEVTPGGNCYDTKWLKDALVRTKPNEQTGEYYLTDLAGMAILDGREVQTVPLPPLEAIGINSIEDAEHAKRRK